MAAKPTACPTCGAPLRPGDVRVEHVWSGPGMASVQWLCRSCHQTGILPVTSRPTAALVAH